MEITEGVTTEFAPGHTAGHTILHIQSGHRRTRHMVDLAHNYVIMFHNPDWTIGVDSDPGQAASTRKSVCEKLAANRHQSNRLSSPLPWHRPYSQEGSRFRVGTGAVETGVREGVREFRSSGAQIGYTELRADQWVGHTISLLFSTPPQPELLNSYPNILSINTRSSQRSNFQPTSRK